MLSTPLPGVECASNCDSYSQFVFSDLQVGDGSQQLALIFMKTPFDIGSYLRVSFFEGFYDVE